MAVKMKLKASAIEVLITELCPTEMMAIYFMGAGSKMPENVSKEDLTRIIHAVCMKLDWVEEDQENNETMKVWIDHKEASAAKTSSHNEAVSEEAPDIFPNFSSTLKECDINLGERVDESNSEEVLAHLEIKNDDFDNKGFIQFMDECHDEFKKEDCGESNLLSNQAVAVKDVKVALKIDTNKKLLGFKCSKCDMKFSLKWRLKRHERIHTGVKTFSCTKCERQFNQGWKLKRHERTHTGDKPFNCPQCDRQFTEKCSKKRHEETVHKNLSNI